MNKHSLTLGNPDQESEKWYREGVKYGDAKKYHEAIECYNKTIELNPKNYDALMYRGVDLYKIHRYDEAEQDLNQVIKNSADQQKIATAYKNMGNLFYRQGELDKALKSYQKALTLQPNNSKAWNGKGSILSVKGWYDEAIKHFDTAKQLKSELCRCVK